MVNRGVSRASRPWYGAGGLIPKNVESGGEPGWGSLAPAHSLALRAASSRSRGWYSPQGRFGAGGHAQLALGGARAGGGATVDAAAPVGHCRGGAGFAGTALHATAVRCLGGGGGWGAVVRQAGGGRSGMLDAGPVDAGPLTPTLSLKGRGTRGVVMWSSRGMCRCLRCRCCGGAGPRGTSRGPRRFW